MGKLSINEKQKFGIEIEYVDISLTEVKRKLVKEDLHYEGWLAKYEETISSHTPEFCGEVTSGILTNNAMDLYYLEKVCDMLNNMGAQVNDECGAHIHFDAEHINIDNVIYLQNLFLLLICYEDVIYKYAAGSDSVIRDGYKTHAKTIHESLPIKYINNYFYESKERSEFEKVIISTFNKTYGINLRNLNTWEDKEKLNINTIEFRMPNGTIDPEIWLNNINTFGLMIEKSLNMPNGLREKLFNQIINEYDQFDIITSNEEKALEFITLIAKCDSDITRFMKQYQKRTINHRYMI